MENLSDKILKFNPDTLQVVRNLYGFDSKKALNDSIDIFGEWIRKQNHFVKKDYDRKYLEIAIILNKGSVERAKTRLDRLCTFRTLMPQFFGDFDIRNDFKEFDGILKQVMLPRLTKDHNRVAILKNNGNKFDSNLTLNYFRLTFMLIEYIKTCDYASSYIVIIDYRDVNMTELATKLSIIDCQHGMTVLTEAYSVRVQALHIISPSKMIDIVVKMFKQVFSEKIGKRIMVHKDLDTLYEHVPIEVLPEDYGGDEKPLDVLYELKFGQLSTSNDLNLLLSDDWVQVIGSKEHREYIKEMSEARTDETRRQKDTFNQEYMGMPGTFRTLSVD